MSTLLTGIALSWATLVAQEVAEAPPTPEVPELPRHLVLFTVDTLRVDRLGSHGYERPVTPSLDRLAKQGTRFARATTGIPVTAPSHTSMFTGLYPLAHGLTSNFAVLNPEVTTLAELLADQGFTTAAFFHHFLFEEVGVTQGFQSARAYTGTGAGPLPDDVVTWLEDHLEDEHLFLWVHLFDPHAPAHAPDAFRKRWERQPYEGPLDQEFPTLEGIRQGRIEPTAAWIDHYLDTYDADVAWADLRLGRIVRALRGMDLLNQSLVVFAADHGESLEQGVYGLHAPVLRQATLHVPLILRGPGIPSGHTVEEVVELIDVFPTILDAFGLTAPPSQGQSLWPLIHGEDVTWDERAFSMLPTHYSGLREGTDAPGLAVQSRHWKRVRMAGHAPRLFDLRVDPGEEADVAAKETRIATSLNRALDQWLDSLQLGTQGGALSPDARKALEELGYVMGGDGGRP